MAKLLTIKLKDNNVEIRPSLPEGMTKEEHQERLLYAIPLALAGTVASAASCPTKARALMLEELNSAVFALNIMLGELGKEEEDESCRCEADDLPDDNA